MATLKTDLCDVLGIEYPIMQAGMGGVAFGPLAAAVSAAGGLGTIAAISPTPERVEEEIKYVRSVTDKPLCVDIGFPARAPEEPEHIDREDWPDPIKELAAEVEALGVEVKPVDDKAMGIKDAQIKMDICEKYGVEVIACALGTPAWAVEHAHSWGAKTMSMIGRASHARSAIRNGTDIVVVQGTEGGGHSGDVGLITLLQEVLSFSTVPVVAAGGLVTGAQIAAVLTQGAAGAWVGTRFINTVESSVGPNYKQTIVESDFDTSIRSLLFDGLYVRQLQNRFTEVWEGREDQMLGYPRQRYVQSPTRFAAAAADLKDQQAVMAGQGSGLITDILPAAEVLERLVRETVEALDAAQGRLTYSA